MSSPKSTPGKKLADALAKDPIYQMMIKGNVKWANIAEMNNKRFPSNKTRKVRSRSPSPSPKHNTTRSNHYNMNVKDAAEILEGFKVPDLKMRKGIWENFPVALVTINDGNGVDRYGVEWHNKNFKEWQKTKPESKKEKENYKHWSQVRLFHSLRQYPRQYKILPPRNPKQLFVLEMVFKKK
jgi:hypothetical protein